VFAFPNHWQQLAFVNNYLKGGAPQAFDLLYWNADGTNLPGPMDAWYLRNMYLENNLCKAERLSMCGTQVDLGKIDIRATSSARRKVTLCRGRALINRRSSSAAIRSSCSARAGISRA
jgi:poly(3-hydroxyalkanoate) synthetase